MNANEVSPTATVTYVASGTYSLVDPQYDASGNLVGTTTRSIPTYTRTVALTAPEQTIFNTEQTTRQTMATIAAAQASRLNTATSSGVSTAGLSTVTAAPTALTSTAFTAPDALDTTPPTVPTLPSAAAARALPSAPSSPTLPTALTAPTVTAGAITAPLMPTASGNITTTISTSVPTAPVIDGMLSDAGPVWDVVGSSDFAAAKDTVIDAVKARLEYQRGLDLTSTIARLVNQGILSGSEAYEHEMRIFNFRATDETTQAVLAGGQEQTRLLNLEVARAQFYNAAQQQRFTQHTLILEIANKAEIATFEWGATATRVANEFAMTAQKAILERYEFDLRADALETDLAIKVNDLGAQRSMQTWQMGVQAGEHNSTLLLRKLEADLNVATMSSKLALDAYQMDTNAAEQAAKFLQGTFAMGVDYDKQLNAARTQAFLNLLQHTQAGNSANLQAAQFAVALGDYQQQKRERELQELLVVRNQPLNEIGTLLRGSQLALPQFKQFTTQPIANTPIGEYIYKSAEMDQKNYETKVGQQAAMIGAIAGIAGSAASGYLGRPRAA